MEYARWSRANRRRRRRPVAFPAFSAVRFSFDISPAWPFVEWPRRERGGNKYKSDLAFRLYHCQPLGRNVLERRDKKEKRGYSAGPFFPLFALFLSPSFSLIFSNFLSLFFLRFLAFLLSFSEQLTFNWGKRMTIEPRTFSREGLFGRSCGGRTAL